MELDVFFFFQNDLLLNRTANRALLKNCIKVFLLTFSVIAVYLGLYNSHSGDLGAKHKHFKIHGLSLKDKN